VAVRGLTRGERNIRWIETYCRIPEGKFVGKPVDLCDFQKEVILGIYDSPTRLAVISFGRKNAKTTLAAFLCLLHACGPEAVRNSQLYSAAQSQEQAALLFELMAKIVRMSPDLESIIALRDSTYTMMCPELGTVYKALSAEKKTAYGKSPVFVVHDELGQVVGPRSGLYEALETAQSAHENPLSIVISTQAATDADLLSVLIDDAKTGADPKTKLYLWTADEALDPFSEEAIRAANPAFDHFMNQTEVLNQAHSAKRMPSSESGYRNLVLNQRVNRNDPFVSKQVWDLNSEPPRDEDFEGGVVLGLDLSERNDLTALVMTGRGSDGQTSVRCFFYAPRDGLEDRAHKDRVPYDLWAEQGFLTATPGATVDYEFVAMTLKDLSEQYDIESVKFDRWRMKYLKKELARVFECDEEEIPITLEDHGQGFVSMAPALDAFEADLLNGRLRHGNNPVLNWNAANAVIVRDAAGNRKFNKAKATGRIDGMVALAMTRDATSKKEETVSGGVVFA
jgi:phage terminase large subunit-like protein